MLANVGLRPDSPVQPLGSTGSGQPTRYGDQAMGELITCTNVCKDYVHRPVPVGTQEERRVGVGHRRVG